MIKYKLKKLYDLIDEIEAEERFFFIVHTGDDNLISIYVYDWETDDLLDGCGIMSRQEAFEYVEGFK